MPKINTADYNQYMKVYMRNKRNTNTTLNPIVTPNPDVIPDEEIPVPLPDIKHFLKQTIMYRRAMRELMYQSKFLSWDKVTNELLNLYEPYNGNKIMKTNKRKKWVFILRELKKPTIPVKKITKKFTIRNNSNINSDFMLWVYKNNKVVADMNQYHM